MSEGAFSPTGDPIRVAPFDLSRPEPRDPLDVPKAEKIDDFKERSLRNGSSGWRGAKIAAEREMVAQFKRDAAAGTVP